MFVTKFLPVDSEGTLYNSVIHIRVEVFWEGQNNLMNLNVNKMEFLS